MDFSDVNSRREEINLFVKKVTENQIPELLSPGSLSYSTNLVLVNAAFFHGLWLTQFHKEHTRMKIFHSAIPSDVEMMHVLSNYSYGKFTSSKLKNFMAIIFVWNSGVLNNVNAAYLEMPYEGEDSAISMIVYLPLENTPAALDNLVNKFTVETMNEALNRKQIEEVEVELPKISLDGKYPLRSVSESI